jgi:predicted nucleic acid-binding protein
MIPLDRLVLLDTNILIHLVRGNAIGRAIDTKYDLLGRRERPLISIVTVGELMKFAEWRNWGERKKATLRELLNELVIVDISDQTILDRYAKIGAYLESNGVGFSRTTCGSRPLPRRSMRCC